MNEKTNEINDTYNYLAEDERRKMFQEMRKCFVERLGENHAEAVDFALNALTLAGGPFAPGYCERLHNEAAAGRGKIQDSKVLSGYAAKAESLFAAAFKYLRAIGCGMYIGDLENRVHAQILDPIKELAGAAEMRATEDAGIDHITEMIDIANTANDIKKALNELKHTERNRVRPIMRQLRRLCDKFRHGKFHMKESDPALQEFARATVLVEIIWIAATGALNDKRSFANHWNGREC